MQRRMVVLPEPEAPKRIVTPGSAWNVTSRVNPGGQTREQARRERHAMGAAANGRRRKPWTTSSTANEKASRNRAVRLASGYCSVCTWS